ncbi:helix-turn-helix transcriptional regulator [candidate division KSB1 bacterium]|nr:helix-turn-helix transcriptional regulator [candidate division KSB1 bacterium]
MSNASTGKIYLNISQLNRKLHALIGQPPGQLIRSIPKLRERAADLLQQGAGNVAEICYQVGFSDQANFTNSFKKQFGAAPREFRSEVERQRTNKTQEAS